VSGSDDAASAEGGGGNRATRAVRIALRSPLVWTCLATATGMFSFEVVKTTLAPALTMWESHAITIAFCTLVATVVSGLALRHESWLQRRVLGEATERARLAEAHRTLTAEAAERQRVEAALRASEAELRALIGAMSDVILVLDRDGRHLKIAPCATDRLYRPAEELLGRRLTEVMPAENAATFLDCIHRALASGGPIDTEYDLTIGGQRLWFAATVSPMTDDAVLWVARDITERKAAEEALRHDAYHDPLTGLPNRAYLTDLLRRALARSSRNPDHGFAVLFLDCDRFKLINDSLGHAAGDQLLRDVAERLTGAVRPSDVVGRLGGDEFTILLEDVADASDAVRAAERVQSVLAEPFTVAGRELFTSVSVGIAVGRPEYGWPDEVLRDADLAMYQAKARGRARYELFTPELRAGADRRLALENDLRRAVERGELRIYYQPIVSLETGRISSAEALVRWQHPERGLIPPAEFLPIAEETGLIVSIGKWVLESACRQVSAWQATSPERHPPMSVSVNVAAAQLVLAGFADTVRETLAATGLTPESLKLEVTEGIISADAAAAVVTLTELARLGVALLIDDFGTGHSSLSYLHRFPISTVKIDQYFVGRMDTSDECHEIVRTIVGLAHALDMDVVAEGVETPKQVELLRALGSEYVQGYLLSRPVPSEGLEAVLRDETVLAPLPAGRAVAEPAAWVGALTARRI